MQNDKRYMNNVIGTIVPTDFDNVLAYTGAPAGTWRNNNVIITWKRRRNVVLT